MNTITWRGSPNYTPGRDGHNPEWTAADPATWIVLHTMVGSIASARAAFASSARQASSTYGVGLDGSYDQYVREQDAPWTNGTMQGVGSNLDSITIEHEDGGDFNGIRTIALYEASAELVADISKRHNIPLVHRGAGGGVLGHRECSGAQTACPDSLDVDFIIARAIAHARDGGAWSDAHLTVIVNRYGWDEIKATLGQALYDRCMEIAHPSPKPPPDTRAEWQKNLVKLPAPRTFDLTKSVPIVQLATGVEVGTVPGPGPLVVAYTTRTAGVDFWLTEYGSSHGNGLRTSDVAAAVAPVVVVPPVVIPPDTGPVVVPPVVVPPVTPPAKQPGRFAGCLGAGGGLVLLGLVAALVALVVR